MQLVPGFRLWWAASLALLGNPILLKLSTGHHRQLNQPWFWLGSQRCGTWCLDRIQYSKIEHGTWPFMVQTHRFTETLRVVNSNTNEVDKSLDFSDDRRACSIPLWSKYWYLSFSMPSSESNKDASEAFLFLGAMHGECSNARVWVSSTAWSSWRVIDFYQPDFLKDPPQSGRPGVQDPEDAEPATQILGRNANEKSHPLFGVCHERLGLHPHNHNVSVPERKSVASVGWHAQKLAIPKQQNEQDDGWSMIVNLGDGK